VAALLLRREGLSLHRAVALLQKHLHLALGGVQLLLADGGEVDAFFEELNGVLEREVALFELADDGFELL
jgi:hypothetical protein